MDKIIGNIPFKYFDENYSKQNKIKIIFAYPLIEIILSEIYEAIL